jgi:hypothetical protein
VPTDKTQLSKDFRKPPKAWKSVVHFAARDNHVSLRQHCMSGSCLRVTVGHLEFLADQNPQRAVFLGVDELIAACNAKQRKHGHKEYSKTAYEKVLNLLRHLEIITASPQRNLKVYVDFQGCSGKKDLRESWVVAPHDFLTHKHNGACHFVGFGNSPDFPIDPVPGPKIWIPQYGPSKWKPAYEPVLDERGKLVSVKSRWKDAAQAQPDGESTADVRPQDGRSTVTVRSLYGQQDGGKDGRQATESTENVNDKPTSHAHLLPEKCLLSTVSQSNPSNTDNPPNPKGESSVVSSGLLTDQKQQLWDEEKEPSFESSNPATAETKSSVPAVRGKTVAEYFDCDDDILDIVTNGDLDRDNPSCKKFKGWDRLRDAVDEAVQRLANAPVRDTKILATIMGVTIDILEEQNPRPPKESGRLFPTSREQLYPKAWLTIKTRLAAGGTARERESAVVSRQQQVDADEFLTRRKQLEDQFAAEVKSTPEYQAADNHGRLQIWHAYLDRHETNRE